MLSAERQKVLLKNMKKKRKDTERKKKGMSVSYLYVAMVGIAHIVIYWWCGIQNTLSSLCVAIIPHAYSGKK